MCIICVDWIKGKMTNDEARRAANEMLEYSENAEKMNHASEVIEMIEETEEDE